jgi:glycosyltransferase involved in cell wall biosynthesis
MTNHRINIIENKKSENTPLISVVMAVYNGGDYLDEAIESILQQTLTNFEFLILDDGSKDNSLKMIEKYADNDSRIKVIARENRGFAFSLNEMLAVSKGKYIARMDQDDIALSHRFELQIQHLENHPKVAVLGGGCHMIDHKGRYLTTFIHPETNAEIQSELLVGHSAISHPSAMIRREILMDNGGYDLDYGLVEELDLWLRLGEKAELGNLREPIMKYRLHSNSVSEKNGIKQREAGRRACEAAWKRRGVSGKYEANVAWRPTNEKESQHSFILLYGWWAFSSQEYLTATIYGLKALLIKPLDISSWKLCLCPSSIFIKKSLNLFSSMFIILSINSESIHSDLIF